MKVIGIGDVHGYKTWIQILNETDADKYIFIGDYFDNYGYTGYIEQIENFRDILEYKKANMDKVFVLLGNHDFHYLKTSTKRYTGYQIPLGISVLQDLLDSAIKQNLIQICHVHDNVLFSHAGVTKTWCEDTNIDMENLEQSINDFLKYRPNVFEFISGGNPYGDDVYQSPIWVRPQSLLENMVEGYTHVVGHTQKDKMYIFKDLCLIDTLGTSGEYLEINDGVFTAKTNKKTRWKIK